MQVILWTQTLQNFLMDCDDEDKLLKINLSAECLGDIYNEESYGNQEELQDTSINRPVLSLFRWLIS